LSAGRAGGRHAARPSRHADVDILVFARTPALGRVKTRLIPRLGAAGAALLPGGSAASITGEIASGATGRDGNWWRATVR